MADATSVYSARATVAPVAPGSAGNQLVNFTSLRERSRNGK